MEQFFIYYVYLHGGRIVVIHDVEKDHPDRPIAQIIELIELLSCGREWGHILICELYIPT